MGSCHPSCQPTLTGLDRLDSCASMPYSVHHPSYKRTPDLTMKPKLMYKSGQNMSAIPKQTNREVTLHDAAVPQSPNRNLANTRDNKTLKHLHFLSEVENIDLTPNSRTSVSKRFNVFANTTGTTFKKQLTTFKTRTSKSRTQKLASIRDGLADFEDIGIDDMSFAVNQTISMAATPIMKGKNSSSKMSRSRSIID